jgi:DNA-binding NtrC family response regulator
MSQPKILIIDDSPFFRSQIENELKSINGSFSHAEDGRKGLDMALLDSYDLIISDIEMPNMDGFALCSVSEGFCVLAQDFDVLSSLRNTCAEPVFESPDHRE